MSDFNFAVSMPKWTPSDTAVYSLWDYFGFPVGVVPSGKSAPTDLVKRAYNLCWNDYYRDENLQSEVDITTNEDVLFSNVSKDYFTSAFTERQRGPVTGLPVNSVISGKGLDYELIHFGNYQTDHYEDFGVVQLRNYSTSTAGHINSSHAQVNYVGGDTPTINVPFNSIGRGPTGDQSGTGGSYTGRTQLGIDTNGVANDLTVTSTAFDICDLRLAYQVQKWQERSLRGGVRYTEFLKSFFNVAPRDDRLQRPEYIGGIRNPVIVQDVIQQSETTSTSAQANEAGHMISADGSKVGTYRAVEYGWLIAILRVVPKIKYTNGINRQFLRNTPFDYYFPTFAHLSEQGIYNEEVFATNSETDNLTIWGYQGIYNEMRYKPNRVVAGLRNGTNGFLFWTMARKFNSLPNLNGNFISTKYMQNDFMRVFQIKDANLTRPLVVHCWNGIKARRPMPYMATPQ